MSGFQWKKQLSFAVLYLLTFNFETFSNASTACLERFECKKRPHTILFQFEDRNCDDSENDQGSKFSCQDFKKIRKVSYVVIRSKGKATKTQVVPNSSGEFYFEGKVSVGDIINATSTSGMFTSDTNVTIWNNAKRNLKLQEFLFHTSCSQNLNLGDTFGSLKIIGFSNEDGTFNCETLLATSTPTSVPTLVPSTSPSSEPTTKPSSQPSLYPSANPSESPSSEPTNKPSSQPSIHPSVHPSPLPSLEPTTKPSSQPSIHPSVHPSLSPSFEPTTKPSTHPSINPSNQPTVVPSSIPSDFPSIHPSLLPSISPSNLPSSYPSNSPSQLPSKLPTITPTGMPSLNPTNIDQCNLQATSFCVMKDGMPCEKMSIYPETCKDVQVRFTFRLCNVELSGPPTKVVWSGVKIDQDIKYKLWNNIYLPAGACKVRNIDMNTNVCDGKALVARMNAFGVTLTGSPKRTCKTFNMVNDVPIILEETRPPTQTPTLGCLPAVCTKRASQFKFLFEGGSCNESTHSQQEKFFCSQCVLQPNKIRYPLHVKICALPKRKSKSSNNTFGCNTASLCGSNSLYYEGLIDKIGTILSVNPGESNSSKFASDMLVEVFQRIDNLENAFKERIVQRVGFHSSCSKNLFLLDKFGMVKLVEFTNEDQGTVGCNINQL